MNVTWRKSSFSGGDGGNCVEVAGNLGVVRDSKNTDGPTLAVDVASLVVSVKAGVFSR